MQGSSITVSAACTALPLQLQESLQVSIYCTCTVLCQQSCAVQGALLLLHSMLSFGSLQRFVMYYCVMGECSCFACVSGLISKKCTATAFCNPCIRLRAWQARLPCCTVQQHLTVPFCCTRVRSTATICVAVCSVCSAAFWQQSRQHSSSILYACFSC
jgi:hypothetical protein